MNFRTLGTTAAIFLGIASSASASIVSFDISGTLGNDGLTINSAFRGATFGGTVDVDTDAITAATGNYVNYDISGYDIDFLSVGGDVISFLGDGEESEESSGLSVLPQSSTLSFYLYENIDNPLTQGVERRFLRLDFSAVTNGLVFSLEALMSADPNLGKESSFELGLLQFGTSQIPTSVAGATATAPSITPAVVPLPAGGLLLLSGLAGVAGLSRRRKRTA